MRTLHLNVASVCADPDDSGILRTCVNLEHVSPDSWPAIAHLVSAAPDLLEALKALLVDNERAYPADLGNVAAAMARAAIAKAEGR